ncbi:MAG: L,D-transpeptidase family protein [Clostridiales bacterium]|nr:L,D-transpeptidase family protein [Clostridiales bacterium]
MNKKWKKAVGITAIVNLSAVAVLYLGGVLFFQNHFFPNTLISGENYGWKSVSQTEEDIRKKTEDYELAIHGRDGIVDHIRGTEIEMVPVFDGRLDEIQEEQNGFSWVSALWKPRSYDVPRLVNYDRVLLHKKLSQLAVFQAENRRLPEDAYIGEYDEKTNSYSIVPEKLGSDIQREAAEQAIEESLSTLQEKIDLETADCFTKPTVTSDTAWINRVANTLNRYVSSKIIYDWNGQEEIIDGSQIHNWLSVENKNVVIDKEKVRGYVNELAKRNDTFGKKREFVTTEGETVILSSGSYGWWSNRSEETEELIKLIRKGETVEREPVYHNRGYVKGLDDIGDSYVEIDLGKQHLYLYIKGKLILESDFVSGNVSRGFATPAGVFGLTYKERNATLRGANYATPVDYWMPFNGNIGMHDAGWRKSFGGNIYKTNGSHGCINLPKDIAAQIYEKVEQGFPVVCYN